MTSQYTNKYIPPTLTVDLVLFSIVDNQLMVLLMERPNEPFAGSWALPGGYVPAGETTLEALGRIVKVKTNIELSNLSYVEQLYAFDTVARDPRGHAVSVTYMAGMLGLDEKLLSNHARLFAVNELPKIAFDHDTIIHAAHKRLAAELQYTNLAAAFLATTFTLTELQKVHETILGQELDKRNFRKRILNADMLTETKQLRSGGVHRPARLYRFKP